MANTWRSSSKFLLLVLIVFVLQLSKTHGKINAQKTIVEEVTDFKDLKKILRTKNNVLVCFVSSLRQAAPNVKIFKEAAKTIKGQGTMLLVDCSGIEAKKMCKKLKVTPEPFLFKHYKDGEFHKDYDRLQTVTSMVNFMRDPSGDIPWEEDSLALDVAHIADAASLTRFLRKETLPTMIMFYAPWCGFCKQLKPEYAAAASELKGESILAAIDVNRPENSVLRQQYNITGFPTMLYYENGQHKLVYEGDNKKDGLVSFMRNPEKSVEKPKEVEWASTPSEVVHLTSDNFDSTLKKESSVLIMFYAPWCGHCKKMKPEYEKAAEKLKIDGTPGILAALDATKEPTIASKFNVRGYPTLKYFKNGELAFDANVRDAAKITEFMKDPKEPPPPPPPEKSWSDEPSEVVHLTDETFKPFLKKKKHVLVMFYAPWCGHCKKAKPEFDGAAEKYKDDPKVEFAAVDCTKFQGVCSALEVKGYPTLKYFHYHNKETKDYNGGRLEADFVNFMADPQNPLAGSASSAKDTAAEKEDDWNDLEGSEDLVHLTDSSFDKVLTTGKPLLVMFYAPWCGHCKKMKPEYALAAKLMKEKGIAGIIAAVDVTIHRTLQDRFDIPGFPTLKYFDKGAYVVDYESKRRSEDIIEFMKNPLAGKSAESTKKDEL